MADQELLKPLPPSRTRHLAQAATLFAESLSDPSREYLRGRGIEGQVKSHGIGEVPQDCDPEWSMYRGMLTIPYVSASGQVTNIRFRRLHGDGPKYLWPTGAHLGPYNVRAIVGDADTVVITEGEIEALTLAELGIAAVGIPGVRNWKHFYARLFDGIQNVIVAGDPDEAGREFNANVQKSIPRALAMYMKKDINDTYVQDGPMPILEAYSKAGGA